MRVLLQMHLPDAEQTSKPGYAAPTPADSATDAEDIPVRLRKSEYQNNAAGIRNGFRKGIDFRGGIYNSKSVTEPLNS